MKAYWGVDVQLHVPAALSQGKSTWYPLDWRLGGPLVPRAVLDAVVRKTPIPRRESNSRIPIAQPVAQRYTD
jgi:hypothetical protein